MTQNLVIFAAIELLLFCIILYVIIRANIFVNTLQRDVGELYIYLPVTIRDIKTELKAFNKYINKKMGKFALNPQEMGVLTGKIFTGIVLARLSPHPLKRNMALISVFYKLWKLRERLKATFLKLFLK